MSAGARSPALVTAVVMSIVAGCKPSARESAPTATASEVLPDFDKDMIPAIEVPHLEESATDRIAFDGVLDEPCWERAVSSGSFVDVGSGKQRKDARIRGEARMFYTDAGLYIGFEVRDGNVRGGFDPALTDPHLWERDTVEVMTKPTDDGTNKDYYELQINPQNLVFDSHFDDYNAPRGGPAGPFGHQEWHATMKSGVKVHGTIDDAGDKDDGYTVELFIDFDSFAGSDAARRDDAGSITAWRNAPRSDAAKGDAAKGARPIWPGRTLRMNFYAMKDNGGVAWSPILGMGNFHKASRFGRVHLAASNPSPP
jgi:hypothetical protein